MKIKKVDDKPMVIHTKKKAKLHTHEPKKATIKAANIYTYEEGKDRADGSPPLSVRKCMKEVAVQKNEKVM